MTWIETTSGVRFDLLSPDPASIIATDISHALARLCRFNGHPSRHYSVAEHSIHVASLVPPEFALEGLMHDAAEAYIGDVTRPLKALLPEYRAIEERIERAIAERFGLIWPWPEPVRLADTAMLALEKRVVMESIREDWAPLPPEPEPLPDIRHWPPHAADTVWFGRFRSYLRERERRAA